MVGEKPIELLLPWPPSVNHYYRHVGPRVLISRKGRDYRESIAVIPAIRAITAPLTGRLSVYILAYPPDRRRRDLDNILKCLLDSLQHAGIYEDDCQVDVLVVVRKDPAKPGRLSVRISEGIERASKKGK